MSERVLHHKALGKRDIFLFSVSAVLLLDTLAAGATSGPSIIFWWLALTLCFLIPLGMICAELGVKYPQQGGIYAWVKQAYGQRWASRVSWYYWANVAVWIPAIFILFSGIFQQLFFPQMSLTAQIILGVALIWVLVFANIVTLEFGKWVPNLGAILKLLIFAFLIVGSFFYGSKHGWANDLSLATLLPTVENDGLSLQYLPAVIYGMLGFELISASSEEMKNPKRDLPKAIAASMAVVVVAFVLATTAILVAIPAQQVDLVDGLIDTLRLIFSQYAWGESLVIALVIGALYTFFSNGVTWGMGANRAAAQAAIDKELPKWFGILSSRGTPTGAAILLGVISSALLIMYGFMATNNEDLFWTLFAFSGVIFILPYIVMCCAFVKIRQSETVFDASQYSVPGNPSMVKGLAYLCALILSVTNILFVYTPGEGVHWDVLSGAMAVILLGEAILFHQKPAKAKESNQAVV
ncbi:APC family permease [Thalassotalea sp. PS06]|uniref:APC family permease n=1 Tax=Thalassotalea sp. PS06 TaxID=2594005 RepID=UPI0011658948|nr:APC family permease [Thalassotalea sp. PS06]QDP00109.1 APC family permease [Thalassotalea sp. PS06]